MWDNIVYFLQKAKLKKEVAKCETYCLQTCTLPVSLELIPRYSSYVLSFIVMRNIFFISIKKYLPMQEYNISSSS